MKYNDNGTIKDLNMKVCDTLPIGAIIEYSGSTIPDGWISIGNNKIQKTAQYMEGGATISNVYGTSTSNGYSQAYINEYTTTDRTIYANEFMCKNLFDGELESGALSNSDGSIIVDSTKIRSKNFIEVKENETYTISYQAPSITLQIFEYDSGGNLITIKPNSWTTTPYTFITGNSTTKVKFVLNSPNRPSVQVEPGETATTWVEHKDYAGGGSSGTWEVYDLPSLLISYRDIKTSMDGYDPNAELFDAVGSFYWNSVTREGRIEGAISLNSSILQNYLNTGYNFTNFINNYYTIPILTFDNIILPFQMVGSTKFNPINCWIGGIVTTQGELSIDTTHASAQQLNSYNPYYLIQEDEISYFGMSLNLGIPAYSSGSAPSYGTQLLSQLSNIQPSQSFPIVSSGQGFLISSSFILR